MGENGIITNAQIASIENRFATYKEEFDTNIVKEISEKGEDLRSKINLLGENVKQYIPSFKDEDVGSFGIVQGKLYYINDYDLGIEVAKRQKIEVMGENMTVQEFAKEVEKSAIDGIVQNSSQEEIESIEKQGGEKLLTKNMQNANSWKIVIETIDGKVVEKYQTGWYYVPKGTEITGLGKLNNTYIMNFETGEAKCFDKSIHKLLSYADVLGYPKNLILNIDPGVMDEYNNLSEEEKRNYDVSDLGDGVELIGYGDDKPDLTQALTSTSYKFDGVDDYIKIKYDKAEEKQKIAQNGFTFEFYGTIRDGKSYDKYGKEYESDYGGLFCFWNGNEMQQANLRCGLFFDDCRLLCSGNTNVGFPYNFRNVVDRQILDENEVYSSNMTSRKEYWNYPLNFDRAYLDDDIYITILVDPVNLENDPIYKNPCAVQKLYINGNLLCESLYNKNLWDIMTLDVFEELCYFCVGRCSLGDQGYWHYVEGDCYSLRFYSEALSDEQVKLNYEKTKDYHNILASENE